LIEWRYDGINVVACVLPNSIHGIHQIGCLIVDLPCCVMAEETIQSNQQHNKGTQKNSFPFRLKRLNAWRKAFMD
jgi:hypothetical protein